MPVQSVSLSNKNYNFIVKISDIRGVGFSQAVNDMVDDARYRFYAKKKKVENEVFAGEQDTLFGTAPEIER